MRSLSFTAGFDDGMAAWVWISYPSSGEQVGQMWQGNGHRVSRSEGRSRPHRRVHGCDDVSNERDNQDG